jgi:predicted Zn-dependent peptidase
MVLNGLLGEGMSSRLYQVIRERYGFAYSVYSFVSLMSDTGVFGVYIGTDRKNVARSLDLVHHELETLRHRAVPLAEIDRAKSQIKGNVTLGLESMSNRMMRLGGTELQLGEYIPTDVILRQIDSVTPESVRRVAHDLFDLGRFSTIVVKPA